jgi:hypothetical protein
MRHRSLLVLLGVAIAGGCGGLAARPAAPGTAPATRVYVLAATHGFHFKQAFGYTMSDLRAHILALQPDIVCFEVTPEHYRTEKEPLFYPPEVAVADVAAAEAKALPWPSDWRPPPDPDEVSKAVREMNDDERTRYEQAYARFMPRLKAAFGEPMFDFWHRPDTLALIREVHDTMIREATDVGAGFWDTRNQMIVKRCMRKAQAIKARRVVFVFGGDHKYGIEDNLRRFYGLRAEPISRLVPRSNDELPEAVIDRWRRNRASLERLLAAGTLPEEQVKELRQRKAVEQLQSAIDARGRAR